MEYLINEPAHRCETIARRLMARYDWQLLEHNTFTYQIQAAVAMQPTADLAYTAYGIYNQTLYIACSGAEGPLRWERGYTELFQMLCDRARYAYPDIWEDAVQGGIEVTCTRITRCSVPQAFFHFAWGHVRNSVRMLRIDRTHGDLSLEYAVGDDQMRLADSIPDPHSDLLEQIMSDELRGQVQAILHEYEQLHQRAHNQFAALLLKFLSDEDDAAIGRLLGVTVKRVHELRALGKKKLSHAYRLREIYDGE